MSAALDIASIALIALGNSDWVAVIDPQDFERVRRYGWYLHWNASKTRCAVRAEIAGKETYLHRFILSPPKDMVVDHIDLDTLNNTRANLRVCTQADNSRNRRTPRVNTSGFKGVTGPDRYGGYRVQIAKQYVGYFMNPVQAARAYDNAAAEIYGKFARLNGV